MKRLPDTIYIVDPYDEDGNLVANTEDVYWCEDPAGGENVAYISRATVAAALAKTICPGCGQLSPQSSSEDGFCCDHCGWECDSLPTVGEIAASGKLKHCNDVNLSTFLRTLFADGGINE